MDGRHDRSTITPAFLDILATLPIEEQRDALAWLRQVAEDLGCIIPVEHDIFVSEKPFHLMTLIEATRSLN